MSILSPGLNEKENCRKIDTVTKNNSMFASC
uniref:Uncharacterized protein n=1 Tax=Ciona intestinalis TaxID=7719 RepID=H2XUX9_CIOIN